MTTFAETKKWTPELDSVLREIGSTGYSSFEWAQLKPVLAAKLETVCAEYYAAVQDLPEPYEELLKRLLALLIDFPNAPFTVQRLCELLLDPHRIYATSTRKVTSALEKLLTVSSTVPTMVRAPASPTHSLHVLARSLRRWTRLLHGLLRATPALCPLPLPSALRPPEAPHLLSWHARCRR